MFATKIQASAEAMDFSRSIASRRDSPSQAKVLSTVSHGAPLIRATMANAARQDLEAFGFVRALYDPDGPVAASDHGILEVRARVAGILELIDQVTPGKGSIRTSGTVGTSAGIGGSLTGGSDDLPRDPAASRFG